jgi:hypothetical protein
MTHRINAVIPDELYERLNDSDQSIAKLVNTSLVFFLENQNEVLRLKETHTALKENNEMLKKELEDLKKLHNDYMAQMQQQSEAKDSQLEKQAIHIQSLIQENSKLNIKLLPENTKKKWWKFW